MKSKSIEFTPRGLSRVQAAYYIGVSTTYFDQLVAERRMPQPKHVGRRRIYDRNDIDTHFDELDDGEAIDSLEQWRASRRQARELKSDLNPTGDVALDEALKAVDAIKASGSEVIYHRGFLMSEEDFREQVLSKPLGKLERTALRALHALGGPDHGTVRGWGGTTEKTLKVRGYVSVETAQDGRWTSWQITPEGVAVVDQGLADD